MFVQVENAKFKRFSYWSNWIDICNFQFAGYGYLLQMKVNRFNGKKFKVVPFGHDNHSVAQATCFDIERRKEG